MMTSVINDNQTRRTTVIQRMPESNSGRRACHLSPQYDMAVGSKACETVTIGGGALSVELYVHCSVALVSSVNEMG